ncbi:MAG: hypothetical protein A2Y62_01415 [Candidatus Fischerbacteria bacterium RBG_13_37_8]|uniref:DUF4097 domain-containing protein n=1 Tax=Candidatus Fischerbacteria bacterium RBG_13_37_8 TaxID=1817863 RepID=A0A1F5VU72_9BACT|nr:MAG: hypothetical protein A2Y62_01415 [Candidatus Fischerbacteria bacterium RBG_13_37_8]
MKNAKTSLMRTLVFGVVLFSAILLIAADNSKEITNKFTVTTGSYLLLENVNGDVVITSWNKNEIDVKAKLRANNEEALSNTNLKMEQVGNEVRIEVKYKEFNKDGFWAFIKYLKHMGHGANATVDFDIKVPAYLHLKSIDTVNGDVRISKVSGNVNVETVNGEIELVEVGKRVTADTVNGSIDVIMSTLEDDVKLETVNGRIRIYLPGEINADVKAENINGSIKTDFPLTVSGKIAGKEIYGKIGRGGNTISCETINGSIQILKKEETEKKPKILESPTP